MKKSMKDSEEQGMLKKSCKAADVLQAADVVMNNPTPNNLPMDHLWWGWVVCFTSFWTNGTIFGIINTYGTVLIELDKKFAKHENKSFLIPLVGSLCVGMTFLLSPIAAILTDCYGIRRVAFIGSILAALGMLLSSFVERLELLYLTYGIMMGTGASLTYTPSLVILGHYFHRYMGLVNGIVTFGSSVFTIVLPLLLDLLFRSVGLKTTFQILTVLMGTLPICALTFKPRLPIKRRAQPPLRRDSESGTTYTRSFKSKCLWCLSLIINLENWRNKRYVIWALTIPAALFGYFVPYVHLVKYVNKTLPTENGNILVTCMGATSGVGRLVFGKLADFPWVNRIFLQQISFFCIGVLTMLVPVAGCFPVLICMCLALGLFDGCFISLLGPIAFDITGPQGASQAIGFLLGLCSIPLTIGPPVAGWLESLLDSYTVPFVCAGIPPVVGAAIMFWINRVKVPPSASQSDEAIQEVISPQPKDGADDESSKLMSDGSVWEKQVRSASVTRTENGLSTPPDNTSEITAQSARSETSIDNAKSQKDLDERSLHKLESSV